MPGRYAFYCSISDCCSIYKYQYNSCFFLQQNATTLIDVKDMDSDNDGEDTMDTDYSTSTVVCNQPSLVSTRKRIRSVKLSAPVSIVPSPQKGGVKIARVILSKSTKGVYPTLLSHAGLSGAPSKCTIVSPSKVPIVASEVTVPCKEPFNFTTSSDANTTGLNLSDDASEVGENSTVEDVIVNIAATSESESAPATPSTEKAAKKPRVR
jgi:hypothetical protein